MFTQVYLKNNKMSVLWKQNSCIRFFAIVRCNK